MASPTQQPDYYMIREMASGTWAQLMEDMEPERPKEYIPAWRPRGMAVVRQILLPSDGLLCFLSGLCSVLLIIVIALIILVTRQGVDQTEQSLEEKMRTINETMSSKANKLSAADVQMMDRAVAIETSLKAFRGSGVVEDMEDIGSLVKQILSEEVLGSVSSDIERILAVMGRLEEEVRYKNRSSDPLCEKGWTHYGGSCYFLSSRLRPWKTAQRECEGKKAQLVVINGREEMDFLKDLIHKQTMWIGLKREKRSDWTWQDGTSYALSQKFWAEGQPRDLSRWWRFMDSLGGCAMMENKGWMSYWCKDSFQYICEKKR